MARSEASWLTSVNSRHEMATQHPSYPRIPFFPAQQVSDFDKTPYTLWDFFPATWTCPHDIQRVGRLGDGGKWVCGMSLYEKYAASSSSFSPPSSPPSPPSQPKTEKGTAIKIKPKPKPQSKPKEKQITIYSFGVNDESTFEAEMLTRIPTAQIHAYDFSVLNFGPQLSPSHAPRAHFSQLGLGAIDDATRSPPFYTLQTLMLQNNHTYIDILKIDIEGSEYTALDAFMDFCEKAGKDVLPVGQMMIELHLVDDKNVDFERFLKW
ncbi:hypothetical protein SBOR_8651 [Sclerotinia borealis F-4128]|uniref:Methyltransferase domain-containing protein n=1 Tax=Sclerotinia borealis (strain F-4128) TaxID=1432307 RepID=W9C5G0_SCLBF|nr:hypothetical protein SBOR_8651 [Sclerotinia borealis F-4128]